MDRDSRSRWADAAPLGAVLRPTGRPAVPTRRPLVTAQVYRRELPGCLLVHLTVTPAEARRRAATRPVRLTDAEFDHLHRVDAQDPPRADHHLDVTSWSPTQQQAAVEDLWAATAHDTKSVAGVEG